MIQWMFSFIDILGFANEVKSISSEEDMKKIKQKISDFVSNFAANTDLNPEFEDSDAVLAGNVFVRSFSDSILRAKKLSANKTKDINAEFQSIIRATNWCIQAGYPVRGGIAIGPHFEGYSEIPGDQFVPIMISPALIDAHKLEATVAKYPRIVVSEKVIEHLDDENHGFLYWHRGIASLDYLWFEFSENDDCDCDIITQHANLILGGLGSGSRHIEKKYRWLKRYHNQTIERIVQANRVEDVSLRIQRDWYDFV